MTKQMRRFFRSAAFPILIVIVLAFFAQRLISPPSSEKTPTFNDFLTQIESRPSEIDSVTFQQKTDDAQGHGDGRQRVLDRLSADHQAPVVNQLARAAHRHDGRGHRRLELPLDPHLHPAVRPVLRLLALPDEPDAGRRLARDELRQVPREADVGRRAEDHLPRRRRRRRGRRRSSTRSRSSSRTRRSSRRSARGSRRACCSTARPAPARRCSRARSPARPGCRSSRSRARTSSRCSSASARAASATSSSRRSRTPPASSSWTRSTPSAATAAPAWAAVTTSASRP